MVERMRSNLIKHTQRDQIMASKLEKLNYVLEGTLYRVVRNGCKHEYVVYFDGSVQSAHTGIKALSLITDSFYLNPDRMVCEINPQPTEVEEIKQLESSTILQYEVYQKQVIEDDDYFNLVAHIVYVRNSKCYEISWLIDGVNTNAFSSSVYKESGTVCDYDQIVKELAILINEGYSIESVQFPLYATALSKATKLKHEGILQYTVLRPCSEDGVGQQMSVAHIVYIRETRSYEINWLVSGVSTKAFSLNKPIEHPHGWKYDQIVNELSTLLDEGYLIKEVDYPLYATALEKAVRKRSQYSPQYKVMTNSQKQNVKEVLHATTIVYDNQINLFKCEVADFDFRIFRLIQQVEKADYYLRTYQDIESLLLDFLRQGFDVECIGAPKCGNFLAKALEKYEEEQRSNQLHAGIIEASKGKQKNDLIPDEIKQKVINRIKLEVMSKDDIKKNTLLSPSDRKTKLRHMNSKINGMIELASFLKIIEKGIDPNQL